MRIFLEPLVIPSSLMGLHLDFHLCCDSCVTICAV